MHVLGDERRGAHEQFHAWARRRLLARLVDLISRFANYEGPGDSPSVTEKLMKEGDVGVALSVLYWPTDEMDLTEPYGAPPRSAYVADIVAELESVEQFVAARS